MPKILSIDYKTQKFEITNKIPQMQKRDGKYQISQKR